MSAREEILGAIATALGDHPAVVAPVPARTPPAPLERDALIELFADRVADYRARVTTATDAEAVHAAIADACARHAVARLAVVDGVPAAWSDHAGVEVVPVAADRPADLALLDGVDGVLTTCSGAIAQTGTIVLDGGPGQGPRAATLVPDLHVCVVDAGVIVDDVVAAVDAMATSVRDHARPVTLVSGPSATSDIELERVEGVHGPRRLEVIIAL